MYIKGLEMANNTQVLDLSVDLRKKSYDWKKDVIINKTKFLEDIESVLAHKEITSLRKKTFSIYSIVDYPRYDKIGLLNIDKNGDTVVLKKGPLLEELKQIQDAQTFERAKYYLERLKRHYRD